MYAYKQRLHLCVDAVTCFALPGGRTGNLLGNSATTAFPALAKHCPGSDSSVHQPAQRIEI